MKHLSPIANASWGYRQQRAAALFHNSRLMQSWAVRAYRL